MVNFYFNRLIISLLHSTKLKSTENCCEKRGEKVFALKKVVFLQSEKKESIYLNKAAKNVRNSRNRRAAIQGDERSGNLRQ
jgi:hypothetical protein